MQEFQNLHRQARVVGQMDPKTAWELDEQLAQFSMMWPKMAEAFSVYAETLDRQIKIDPRLVAAFVQNIAAMNELHKHFSQTRKLYRQLYAQFLEQQGVRMPDRKGFFDQKAA